MVAPCESVRVYKRVCIVDGCELDAARITVLSKTGSFQLRSRTVGMGRPYMIGRLKYGVAKSHLTTEPGQSSQYPLAIRERPRVVSGLQYGATL